MSVWPHAKLCFTLILSLVHDMKSSSFCPPLGMRKETVRWLTPWSGITSYEAHAAKTTSFFSLRIQGRADFPWKKLPYVLGVVCGDCSKPKSKFERKTALRTSYLATVHTIGSCPILMLILKEKRTSEPTIPRILLCLSLFMEIIL